MSTEETKITPFKPVTEFDVVVSLPAIYPSTAKDPFVFRMKLQLVKEAQELQTAFLMRPDMEQDAGLHEYNATMLAQLCTKEPQGFPGFAEATVNMSLGDAIKTYFFPDDLERREGMAFICRRVMNRYWQGVQPADYL